MKRLMIAGLVLILSLTVAFGQQRFGVYTTLDEPLAKALFDEYQKETGIVLNWQRLSGGEVEARLEAEGKSPGFHMGGRSRTQSHKRQAERLDSSLQIQDAREYSFAVSRSRELLGRALYRAHLLCNQQ